MALRMKLSPREVTLLVVLAAAGLIALYYLGDPRRRGAGGAAEDEGPPVGQAPVIHMALLQRDAADYDPNARNLFKYYTPPPPPPPPRPEPRRIERPPPPPPTQMPPRTPRKPVDTGPRPPAVPFTYIGYLGPKDGKIAVFEVGPEKPLLLGQSGEVVAEQFRVVEFRYQSVVLGYTDPRFAEQTTELHQMGVR